MPAGRNGPTAPATTRFKGATTEMDGKVFQTYEERSGADQFDDTKEKLEEYTVKYIKGEEGKDEVRAM
eukprot:scaffold6507_cov90-Cylindrotheca_fusiformis.AAC.5